eukprot:GHVQ01029339.1.p1 GENE.GHVQ01029339.1~~GHVQ01029339.1.p1  ORF type:complete len:633 (-),score=82.67 GHVQ01029339.1:340-2238(-)
MYKNFGIAGGWGDQEDEEDEEERNHEGGSSTAADEEEETNRTGENDASDLESADDDEVLIPCDEQVRIPAHDKIVNALTLNAKASRMLTGGGDYKVRMWEFNAMTSAMRSFKQWEPKEGNSTQAIQYNQENGNILLAAGDSICRIYNSDAKMTQETVKGDMYIRDMNNTKGHTHMVTDVQWHPFNHDQFITSSNDATVRIWDINASPWGIDQSLPHLHCLKAVDRRNLNISNCHVLCCCWASGDAKAIVGGCVDGSIQLWNERKCYGKPDKVVRGAHGSNEVTGLCFFSDNTRLLSRGMDDTLKMWDVRKLKESVKVISNLSTTKVKTNVIISSDERFVLTGTQASRPVAAAKSDNKETPSCQPKSRDPVAAAKSDNKETPSCQPKSREGTLEIIDSSDMSLAKSLPFECGVVRCEWPTEINQLLLGCTDGTVRMLYDRKASQKGALLFVGRAAAKQRLEDDFGYVAPIYTPGNLPQGYRETRSGGIRKVKPRGKEKERIERETQKTIVPMRPVVGSEGSGGARAAYGSSMSQFILGQIDKKDNEAKEKEDPVEILRSFAKKSEGNPNLIGRAYAKTQPVNILDYTMDKGDDEELLSGSRKCPRCGLKMCQCGYMELEDMIKGPPQKQRKIE